MRDCLKIAAVLSALLLSYLAYVGTPASNGRLQAGATNTLQPGISVVFNRK